LSQRSACFAGLAHLRQFVGDDVRFQRVKRRPELIRASFGNPAERCAAKTNSSATHFSHQFADRLTRAAHALDGVRRCDLVGRFPLSHGIIWLVSGPRRAFLDGNHLVITHNKYLFWYIRSRRSRRRVLLTPCGLNGFHRGSVALGAGGGVLLFEIDIRHNARWFCRGRNDGSSPPSQFAVWDGFATYGVLYARSGIA